MDGSSPHTWGIRRCRPRGRDRHRFIPTYVGHTSLPHPWRRGRTVHPHICGAYFPFCPGGLSVSGSSPHTWGIRPVVTGRNLSIRFIPTYVGHTIPPETRPRANAVHPHIRGAYNPAVLDGGFAIGSSPHTWGILQVLQQPCDSLRFIPTYVGHTPVPHISHFREFGSSPHTWGIRLIKHGFQPCDRFIPTYVGHTRTLCAPHPRWGGSSPHTWGIPVRVEKRRPSFRFIPTYVGHTYPPSHKDFRRSVHPHIRGAYPWLTPQNGNCSGSSPHTWGILRGEAGFQG